MPHNQKQSASPGVRVGFIATLGVSAALTATAYGFWPHWVEYPAGLYRTRNAQQERMAEKPRIFDRDLAQRIDTYARQKNAILLETADWCEPCQQVEKYLRAHGLEQQVQKVTVTTNKRAVDETLFFSGLSLYRDSGIPRIILIEDQQAYREYQGYAGEGEMVSRLTGIPQKLEKIIRGSN